jgi:hypothetical protein
MISGPRGPFSLRAYADAFSQNTRNQSVITRCTRLVHQIRFSVLKALPDRGSRRVGKIVNTDPVVGVMSARVVAISASSRSLSPRIAGLS